MNNPYDLHSWTKLYRQERLAEASWRHFAKRTRHERHPERNKVILDWRNLLSLLRFTQLSE